LRESCKKRFKRAKNAVPENMQKSKAVPENMQSCTTEKCLPFLFFATLEKLPLPRLRAGE
jgi:23S rRNA maturation mini-RNase III